MGLHDHPGVIALAAIAIMLCLVGVFLAAYRQSKELAGILATPVVVLVVLAAISTPIVVLSDEHGYDARDAYIAHKLDTAGIEVVGSRDMDRRVVVSRKGCTAKYDIQSGDLSSRPNVWPLVGGTGQAIDGCSGAELDKLFIPRPATT